MPGVGKGFIDRLHQLGYSNVMRAEMWCEMAEWLKTGNIPDDHDLRTDLAALNYKYSRNGRIQLESKADIKERLKRSPDGGDALALTFAMPVIAKTQRRNHKQFSICEGYNFFPGRR